MKFAISLLFFLSGALALVYEIVWSKYLTLMFGSTVHAQTIVLSVFMGGLALGNWLFGRRSDAMQKPVLAYGWIEICIGAFALLFNTLYAFADGLFVRVAAGFLDQSTVLLLLKIVFSASLLLVPTILMGGTLPILAAWLQKSSKEPGRSSALFYAINTLGAVTGAWLAGFILVHQFGTIKTLQIAGGANLLVGIAAVILGSRVIAATKTKAAAPQPKASELVAETGGPLPKFLAMNQFTLACVLVFVTGAISMGLEIIASRSLAMMFGSSLQAFSVMLIAFIFGIGLGGIIIGSLRKPAFIQANSVIVLLIAAAVLIAVFLVSVEQWSIFYLKLRNRAEGPNKYLWHQIVSAGISIVALSLPAALIGAVLPLWMRILSTSVTNLGSQVGRLLTWNTLGAVTGALLMGFVVMPWLGLRLAFGVLGICLCCGALLVSWRNRVLNTIPASIFCAIALLVLSVVGKEDWEYVFSYGLFRERSPDITADVFKKFRERDKLLFYKDGSDATVSVVTDRVQQPELEIVLAINGKPDGSILGDLSTEYLLAHLPMMARPEAKDVFLLGFGTGMTAGALLGHPIESLTIAENCGPVLEAAKIFEPHNRGVLKSKLTKLYREDARTILKLSPKQYDIIISEPSNPWTSGIGSVFSREFYELAASRLKDGGVFSQWFHLYEMSDEVCQIVLRTFQHVFPSVEIWETRHGDLVLLGSRKPLNVTLSSIREVYFRIKPKEDLKKIGMTVAEAVWARQVASEATSFAIAGEGPIQSDFFPVLEYKAPKAFYEGGAATDIFIYDERMLQSVFAPAEKKKTMLSLRNDFLLSVFEKYGTANSVLANYLGWRAELFGFDRGAEVYTNAPFLNFIFRRPDSYPKEPQFPANASDAFMRLLQGEVLIYQADRQKEGIDLIETVLKTYNYDTEQEDKVHPRLSHFAAIAAKARFQQGDRAGALQTVLMGLNLVADDVQLLYLKRIFEREDTSVLAKK